MTGNIKPINDKERNATRSREAILDAAEELFAHQGYEGTSLNQVGMKAGVSRGTPGYFFGSKESLYQAMLERCFSRVRDAIRSGRDRALASHEPSEVVLAGAVAEYFDFIMENPNFVRLMEREALSGAEQLNRLPSSNIAAEAVSAISEELGLDTTQGVEAAHLVLSIIGLCWFPAVHARTVMPALGFNAADDTFASSGNNTWSTLFFEASRGAFQYRLNGEQFTTEARNPRRGAMTDHCRSWEPGPTSVRPSVRSVLPW